MAIPTSPSVVVLENDVSIYTPNLNSSVVGVVGFADKGPVDTATLITSPEGLLRTFGKPSTSMPGQGLEGALEILEATNQLYFVRAASTDKASASASIPLGACPAVQFSASAGAWDASLASSVYYAITPNDSTTVTSGIVTLGASSTAIPTKRGVFLNAFNPDLTGGQDVFGYVDASDNFFLASKWAGSGATLQVSAADLSSLVLDSLGNAGALATNSTATGFTASGNAFLGAYAMNPGTGYNLSGLRDGSTQGVSVEVANVSVDDTVTVNVDGAQNESFNVNFIASGSKFAEYLLINDTLNNKSDYIYLNAASGGADFTGFTNIFGEKVTLTVGGDAGAGTPRFVKAVAGTYSFVNGNSGYSADASDQAQATSETALIGTSTAKTGIHALDDDSLNISLAIVPGINDDNVQNELITLAESSQNFLALVSPPYGLTTVQDAFDWLNGKGTRTAAINSSYAAAYWPWVQVFNPFAGAEEWYDPAIFAARQCVFTDSVSEPWFAPAGFRRGRLTKPTDTEMILNQGDRDALYANALNPIAKESGTGITIFGQKTTQRIPTALDRVNVRRMMIYVRKVLLELGKPFQFEPNDSLTWELVEEALRPFLSDLLARRAVIEADVKCDPTTNTPARVDRNELWCSISIKPTKAAETIVFEVNLTSQSATLNG